MSDLVSRNDPVGDGPVGNGLLGHGPVGLGAAVRAADLRIEAAVAEIEAALVEIDDAFPEVGARIRMNIARRFESRSTAGPAPTTVRSSIVSPQADVVGASSIDGIAHGRLYGVISNDICAYLSDEPNGLSVDDLHQFLDISGIDVKRTTLIKYLRRMAETALIRTRSRGLYVLNEASTAGERA